LGQPADGDFDEQVDQGADKQKPHVVFQQFPPASNATSDVQFVFVLQKVSGTGKRRRRAGLRGFWREGGGEFGEFFQRAEFRVALRLHQGLFVEPAFGNPLAHVVRRDRAVFLLVAADDGIHVIFLVLSPDGFRFKDPSVAC